MPHFSTLPTMRSLFLTSALLLCWAGTCHGLTVHDLGRHGRTYPIAERDMAELVRERASKLDLISMRRGLSGDARRFELPREMRVQLPEATETKERPADVSYTLPHDIRDERGHVIYPAGYRFNPLGHVSFAKTVAVVDARRPTQLRWLDRLLKERGRASVLVLVAGGSPFELGERLKTPAYYLLPQIKERLALARVPSLVWEDKARKVMVVREVCVSCTK